VNAKTLANFALSFLWLVAPAAAAEPTVETVAPGLRHLTISKGEAATNSGYRILIGVYDRQSEADRALELALDGGVDALPTADGSRYRVVTPKLSDRAEAESLRSKLLGLAFPEPMEIREVRQDLANPTGPWKIHILEADPENTDIQVVHASDAAIGLETTAELASRRGAVAAINGGYFRMQGPLAGDSLGTLQIDGLLLSEPDRGRAAVGFYSHDGAVRSVFGRLAFDAEIRLADGTSIPLDGINRPRRPSEIVLYTPNFHRTTLTPSDGAEVIIENTRIVQIREGSGSSVIPANGGVLSLGSERTRELLPSLRIGDELSVKTDIRPLLPDPEGEWKRAEDILGGGPLLLWKGQRLEEPEKESISRVFFLARHPRTAVGVRADGTLLFVTVDGRRPDESVGMSLRELTDLMLELGCVSANNLDGGGSTTMVIDGRVVNRPSGGLPRRNADGILIFSRAE
jgi:hypothetical protein